MAESFAIVSWNQEGKQITDRSRIRSLCMKGKNKREGSRRSIREARRRTVKTQPQPGTSTITSVAKTSNKGSSNVRFEMLRPILPPPLDAPLESLANRVNKTACGLLRQVLMWDELVNGKEMFPVEVCVNFDFEKLEHLKRSLYDDVFMHSILLVNSAVRDYTRRLQPTEVTQFHLSKTLSLLNQRLGDKDAHMMDSTIYIVLSLATMSAIFGDGTAASTHMDGLQRVIDLRGGHEYLRTRPKLQFKLEMADLVWCLAFGREPLFLLEDMSLEDMSLGQLYHPLPPTKDSQFGDDISNGLFDHRLVVIFRDLQYLANLINESNRKNVQLPASTFQPLFSSAQARLLKLKDTQQNPVSECFCLGALAFLSTTFRLPGRRLEYSYLSHRLREACLNIDAGNPELRILIFWLLMVCGISVFQPTDPWLRTTWKKVTGPGITWNDAKQVLGSVLWIPSIQDQPGEVLFAVLTAWNEQNMKGPS